MLKTGFRGERKRILTPSLSQGEGECRDGKQAGWEIRELENKRIDKLANQQIGKFAKWKIIYTFASWEKQKRNRITV